MPGSDLVARLGVDDSAWTSGFAKARSTASSFSTGISSLFSPIGVAVGVAGAAIGAAFGASSSVSAYKESIQAQRKLSAVIEATGGAAGVTTGEIAALAADLQRTTNFEDDATTAAAGMLAAFTNVRGDEFKGAIVQAQNLAAVMGGDLESNVKLLGKALNNPAEGLKKLARSGITFTDQQKQQIATMQAVGDIAGAQGVILAAVEGRFGGAAEAMADPWTQLQNTFGDVAENIGSLLLPAIDVISETLNWMMGPIVESGDSFKSFGIEAAVALTTVGEWIGNAATSLGNTLYPMVVFVGDSFASLFNTVGLGGMSFQAMLVEASATLENLGGFVNLAMDQWALFFVQIGLDAAHTFTEVIPAHIMWLGSTLVNATANMLTAFANLGENIRSIWTETVNFFTAQPVNLNWKPLTDGFIDVVGNLPDIHPRIITELESGLQQNIANDIASLDASMQESRDSFNKGIDGQRERITAKYDTESKVPSGAITPELTTPGAKEEKEGKAQAKAALVGSSDAAAIFTRGIGGGKDDIAKKHLSVAEKTLSVQEKIEANLAKMEQDEVVDGP